MYNFLSTIFEALGRKIAKDTSWFVIMPLFLVLLFATGLRNIKFENTLVKEMDTLDGDTIITREYILSNFDNTHSGNFDPARMTTSPKSCSVIILAKDGQSILRPHILKEILTLDNTIRKLSIKWKHMNWKYADISEKQEMSIERTLELLENGANFTIDNDKKGHGFNPLSLGGVQLDEDSNVVYANSIKLMYFLDNSIKYDNVARQWEKQFLDEMSNVDFDNATVYKDASIASEEMFKALTARILPLSLGCYCLVIALTVTISLKRNSVRSKPWIAAISGMSTVMSLISTCGLLAFVGVELRTSCLALIFLVMGMATNDSFLMLTAMNRTDSKQSVRERMAETMAKAGVFITLSLIANVIVFGLGAILLMVRGIKIFSLYVSVSLFFNYICQMTFVSGILAFSEKAKESRLRSLDPLYSRNKCCTGKAWGSDFCSIESDSASKEATTSAPILSSSSFWSKLADAMTKKSVKVASLLFYVAYLSSAGLGYSRLSSSIAIENENAVYDSFQHAYSEVERKDYRQFQYTIQVIIPGSLNYADPEIQQEVEEMIKTFESHPLFSGSHLTESWLRSFRKFISDKRTAHLLENYNLTNTETFCNVLRTVYFESVEAKLFKKDVVFNFKQRQIVASRFLLRTNFSESSDDFHNKVVDFKRMAKNTRYPVLIYHPFLAVFDSLDSFPSVAIQSFVVSIIILLLCSTILPTYSSVVCVAICQASVLFGLIGFLLHLGTQLNYASLAVAMTTCGFSVAFSVIACCGYYSFKATCPSERLCNAVNLIGRPIFLGSTTTISCVATLIFVPYSGALLFIKAYSLALIISSIHGILLIPLLLSVIDSICFKSETILHLVKEGVRKFKKRLRVTSNANMGNSPKEKHNGCINVVQTT